MRVGFVTLLGISVLLGCKEEHPYQRPIERKQLPESAPFKYRGKVLLFPAGTLETRADEVTNMGPYARIKPQGRNNRFNYWIELGRPDTGQSSVGRRMNVGFSSFGPNSVQTKLRKGYLLWCEPIEQSRGGCAVLLKSLPLAALEFPITKPPSDAEAEAAIDASEKFLKSMIVN